MSDYGITSGNAVVLDWRGSSQNASSKRNGRASDKALPDVPKWVGQPREDIQVFDSGGLDTLYYQAHAGLEQLYMNAIAQGYNPTEPTPGDPKSYEIISLLTQAKQQLFHDGERLAQAKESQDAIMKAMVLNKGMTTPGFYKGGLVTPELIADEFLAGNPENAISQINQRLRMQPQSAQEENDLQEFYQDSINTTREYMGGVGYNQQQIERAVSSIVPPGRYNPSADLLRKRQGDAAITRAVAAREGAKKKESGSGQNSAEEILIYSIANAIETAKREQSQASGASPGSLVRKEIPVRGGKIEILGDGNGLLSLNNLETELSPEEKGALADEFGEDVLKELSTGDAIPFDTNDLAPLIKLLITGTTVEKTLMEDFYPKILDSDGRINSQSILRNLPSKQQSSPSVPPNTKGSLNKYFNQNN